MQYQIIMKNVIILLLSLLAFASCSDKEKEFLTATPIYSVIIQVTDSDGNDLLDMNNENCVLDTEYLRMGLMTDPLRTDSYSVEFNVTETGSAYGTVNEKLTENIAIGELMIYHKLDKYSIRVWVPGFWSTIYHQFKITWRDGAGSDVIKMEMGDYGLKSEFRVVNGVELEQIKKGSHMYKYTIVK